MNIGVAKPSEDQLQAITHHFINSHSIREQVSAGHYERYGLEKLDTIFKSKDIAVCVGGTGMYIKAICEGIDEMPEINDLIYTATEKEYLEKGMTWLKEEVKKTDEHFFAQGETENPARLLRALTFFRSEGKSILTFRTREVKKRNFTPIYYAIDIDRNLLYNRINTRVDNMIKDGLIDEVKELLPYKDLKSLNTVGYSELFNYFDGIWDLEYSIDKIKQHSRNYAKRQITWFKHQGPYLWMEADNLLANVMKQR
jgi:tRNA dimethylallyltransferase